MPTSNESQLVNKYTKALLKHHQYTPYFRLIKKIEMEDIKTISDFDLKQKLICQELDSWLRSNQRYNKLSQKLKKAGQTPAGFVFKIISGNFPLNTNITSAVTIQPLQINLDFSQIYATLI